MLKTITIVSSIFYFIPLLIVLIRKCWTVRPVFLFALYWTIGGIINLVLLGGSYFSPSFNSAVDKVLQYYNVFDPVAVLSLLYVASKSVALKRVILVVNGLLLAGILLTAIISGLDHDSIKYVLGVGVIAVFIFSLAEIIYFTRKLVFHWQQEVMIYIYAAMVYEYGTYLFTYWLDYWYKHATEQEFLDSELMYNLSTIIGVSISLASFLHAKLNPKKREPVKPKAKPTEREISYL